MRVVVKASLAILSLAFSVQTAAAELSPETTANIDAAVQAAIEQVQAPSASIAIVLDGHVTYIKAYGNARLEPEKVPATTDTRYAIGSVSKQIVAAAVLLLAEDGKLRLDDPVSKHLAGLTSGEEITIRHLLNHTSGYRDYYPQDYVFPAMKLAVEPSGILDQWARVPLDFPPSEQWQYSNTGYTAAGLIVEKVSGQKLSQFMQQRIFEPLLMERVVDHDRQPLAAPDAGGYTRVALGPIRPATKEGTGWLFGAGQLAMPPSSLARWNISVINQSLLKPESYREMTTPASIVKNPRDVHYGLGVLMSRDPAGRRVISHGGGVAGSTTANSIWPDQRAAISVVVNADWAAVTGKIVERIRDVVLPADDSSKHPSAIEAEDADVKAIFVGLQDGKIDVAKLTPNAKAYFHEQALRDAATGLAPLGEVKSIERLADGLRGGLDYRSYRIACENGSVTAVVRTQPDGLYEQFMVDADVR